MDITEALTLINTADEMVAKIDWCAVTNNFEYKLISDLFDGIADPRIFAPVKNLMVAQWNRLVAAEDKRVGDWWNNDYQPYCLLENDIDRIITTVEDVRRAEQALSEVQKQVSSELQGIRESGVPAISQPAFPTADRDEVSPRGETAWQRSVRIEGEHADSAVEAAEKLESLLDALTEQTALVKGAVGMMRGQGNITRSLYKDLLEERVALKEDNSRLKEELELIRNANGDVVRKFNQEIGTLKKELIMERQKANGLYVSLDSILEWASEQHKDNKDVTLIQNMIYDRFELTRKGKEMIRKLAVDDLRQIIVQHADQVIGMAEKDSRIIHTEKHD